MIYIKPCCSHKFHIFDTGILMASWLSDDFQTLIPSILGTHCEEQEGYEEFQRQQGGHATTGQPDVFTYSHGGRDAEIKLVKKKRVYQIRYHKINHWCRYMQVHISILSYITCHVSYFISICIRYIYIYICFCYLCVFFPETQKKDIGRVFFIVNPGIEVDLCMVGESLHREFRLRCRL